MILVTGATGHLGTATINQLLKKVPATQVAALARSEEKAAGLKARGVDVRIGDFNDTASLNAAMQGITKVLLISTVSEQRLQEHINVVDAAKRAGVKHILYTGIAMKDINTSAIKALMNSHFETEDYIKQSGLTYTLLRNSLYADVLPMFVGEAVFENGIALPGGNGKATYALRREMGEAAANILASDGHENKTYHITGSDTYSYADVAAILSELSGKDVTYTDVPQDEFAAQLKAAGLPDFAIFLTGGFATDTKNNQFDNTTNDLEQLLGRKPADLKTALKEVYGL